MLQNLSKDELAQVLKNAQSGKRLGVNLTPAEASGSPIAAKYEGRLGINPENERALVDFKGGQQERQGEAINTLLNKISPIKI